MGLIWTDRLEEVSRAEWTAALSRSRRPSPFLSPTFLVPWARHFAAGRPLRIGRWEGPDGRPPGFLFLYRSEGRGWELLGGEAVSDALDAVVAAGDERAFWSDLLRGAEGLLAAGPVLLPNLVEGTPALEILPPLCRELGYPLDLAETDRAPYIPLPESFDAYLSALGKKERHELRRKMRRAAEAMPGLSLRRCRTASELSRDFPAFVDLLRRSHSEKERFMDDRMAAFFGELAEGFLAEGRLRLAVLGGGPAGDVAAAFQIACDKTLLLYNSGFDPRFREASPGLVLLARCIEEAIGEGRREYDFLRGTERYKYDLGGRDRAVYRALIGRP